MSRLSKERGAFPAAGEAALPLYFHTTANRDSARRTCILARMTAGRHHNNLTDLRAPHRVSDETVSIDITGYFSPFRTDNQPITLSMPGTDDLFIGVWQRPEDLRDMMAYANVDYDKIVRIEDGLQFMASLRGLFRVAVNLRKKPNGKIGFFEIENAAALAAPETCS